MDMNPTNNYAPPQSRNSWRASGQIASALGSVYNGSLKAYRQSSNGSSIDGAKKADCKFIPTDLVSGISRENSITFYRPPRGTPQG
jgi:hypothetical protein